MRSDEPLFIFAFFQANFSDIFREFSDPKIQFAALAFQQHFSEGVSVHGVYNYGRTQLRAQLKFITINK